jgi:hypothetical protein
MMELEMFTLLVPTLLGAAGLGIVTALLAAKKGRNAFGWWLFGTLFFLMALPMLLILEPTESGWTKKCAHCAQWVKKDASRCRYCGERL